MGAATRSPVSEALQALLWATMPLRNVLKGEARANFMAAWCAASDALCKGAFSGPEAPPEHARKAAVYLFRQSLRVALALGVKPHELTPEFNNIVEGDGATGSAEDALTLLGRYALSTARLSIQPNKEDAA